MVSTSQTAILEDDATTSLESFMTNLMQIGVSGDASMSTLQSKGVSSSLLLLPIVVRKSATGEAKMPEAHWLISIEIRLGKQLETDGTYVPQRTNRGGWRWQIMKSC